MSLARPVIASISRPGTCASPASLAITSPRSAQLVRFSGVSASLPTRYFARTDAVASFGDFIFRNGTAVETTDGILLCGLDGQSCFGGGSSCVVAKALQIGVSLIRIPVAWRIAL